MALYAREHVERGSGACAVPPGFQAHAHDAVENEGQEADQRVRADALGQPMVDWRDLDVRFEHAEAPLDVGKALVAGDGLGRGQVRGVGDQRELAVEEFRLSNGVFIDVPAEAICVEIGLEEAREFCLCDGSGEAAVGPAVGSIRSCGACMTPATTPSVTWRRCFRFHARPCIAL